MSGEIYAWLCGSLQHLCATLRKNSTLQPFNFSTYLRTLITLMRQIFTDKISEHPFHPCMPGAKRKGIRVPIRSFLPFALSSMPFALCITDSNNKQ